MANMKNIIAVCVLGVALCNATTTYNNNNINNNRINNNNNGFEIEDILEDPMYNMLLLKKAAANLGGIGGQRTGHLQNGHQRTINGLFGGNTVGNLLNMAHGLGNTLNGAERTINGLFRGNRLGNELNMRHFRGNSVNGGQRTINGLFGGHGLGIGLHGGQATNGIFASQRTGSASNGGKSQIHGLFGGQGIELKNGNGLFRGLYTGNLGNAGQRTGGKPSGGQEFGKVLKVMQGTGNGLSEGQRTSNLITAYGRYSALKHIGFF